MGETSLPADTLYYSITMFVHIYNNGFHLYEYRAGRRVIPFGL